MNFDLRENNVVLLGDTHSYRYIYGIITNRPALDGKDIIFLGDGGEDFPELPLHATLLQRINKQCKQRDIRLYWIRGNHSLPTIWTAGYEFSNLFLAPDYSTVTFPNGKKGLLVGGGISVDRITRVEGQDYWKYEITPYQKVEEKFTYLFSHDCPEYFNHSTDSLRGSRFSGFLRDDPTLLDEAFKQRLTLNKIVEDIKPKFIYSGHFHSSLSEEKFGIKYRCVDICETILVEV